MAWDLPNPVTWLVKIPLHVYSSILELYLFKPLLFLGLLDLFEIAPLYVGVIWRLFYGLLHELHEPWLWQCIRQEFSNDELWMLPIMVPTNFMTMLASRIKIHFVSRFSMHSSFLLKAFFKWYAYASFCILRTHFVISTLSLPLSCRNMYLVTWKRFIEISLITSQCFVIATAGLFSFSKK